VPLILLSCIDIGLFRFTGKRSGMEIFSIMSFGNDFVNTLPKMIIDFWYLLLIFLTLIFLIIKAYPELKSTNKNSKGSDITFFNSLPGKSFLLLFFTAMTFIGFRGGIQLKPLNILSASRYGVSKTTTLVLNTPFTIIKTFGKQTIEDINYMSDDAAHEITPVIKTPRPSSQFIAKNVVIFILESFGKEYIGSLNSNRGYTPFLDSLIGHSLVFPNAYANGKRSIEGIPAIVAGIPSLINDPFITSAYSGNSITTISSLLKSKGYSSVFFHGGTNGTMGFDNFSKLAGFDQYFGRTEYNNDNDFDGNWGIYDEPFLQRTATEMNKMKFPFLSVIFTLSSHHPYKIPEKYEKQFPEGTLPIHQSIGYADYSLKKFFETASKMPWYNNTLFVITGDHTALSEKPFYRNRVGLFALPIIFYSPCDSLLHGKNMTATQQIDILPSIMDYLGYDQTYFALGKSVFDNSTKSYAVNFVDGSYQLIQDDYSFVMDSISKNSLFKFDVDSSLKNDLAGKDSVLENKMEIKLKSVIQNFNHALLHNELK
jgi:phosphoglycerol transferase MdoB-like AlkP superfamily enzyme